MERVWPRGNRLHEQRCRSLSTAPFQHLSCRADIFDIWWNSGPYLHESINLEDNTLVVALDGTVDDVHEPPQFAMQPV